MTCLQTSFVMEQSPPPLPSSLVHPDERDILIGRGHNVYNYIGNRRFRRLVDLHIQEYVESDARSHKTGLVRSIIEIVQKSGYRFLKQDEKGVFAELSYEDEKKKVNLTKCTTSNNVDNFVLLYCCDGSSMYLTPCCFQVGHSLRDRSGLLEQHLEYKLQTREQLEKDKTPIMDYVEKVTPRWHEREVVVSDWAYPRMIDPDGPLKISPSRDVAAASCLLKLSSSSSSAGEAVEDAAAILVSGFSTKKGKRYEVRPTLCSIITAQQEGQKMRVPRTKKDSTLKKKPGPPKKANRRYIRSLNEIVVPTLQNGHDALPVAGGWKFFPLPEFRNKKVDLGTHANGWKLQLAPISFKADSIMLDVPTYFVKKGSKKPSLASSSG